MSDSHTVELGRSLVVLYNLEHKLKDLVDGATDVHREMWLVAPALEAIKDCLEHVIWFREQCQREKAEHGDVITVV